MALSGNTRINIFITNLFEKNSDIIFNLLFDNNVLKGNKLDLNESSLIEISRLYSDIFYDYLYTSDFIGKENNVNVLKYHTSLNLIKNILEDNGFIIPSLEEQKKIFSINSIKKSVEIMLSRV